jgi:hypothetical protein
MRGPERAEFIPAAYGADMTPDIETLTAKVGSLEAELEAEPAQCSAEFHVGMEKRKVFFEAAILRIAN